MLPSSPSREENFPEGSTHPHSPCISLAQIEGEARITQRPIKPTPAIGGGQHTQDLGAGEGMSVWK